jgi:hypothetical protein
MKAERRTAKNAKNSKGEDGGSRMDDGGKDEG